MSRRPLGHHHRLLPILAILPLCLLAACAFESALDPDGKSRIGDSGKSLDDPGRPDDPGNPPDDDPPNPPDDDPPEDDPPVDDGRGIMGNSLPGSWRPFADSSPWNTRIASNAPTRAGSNVVINYMKSQAGNIRFSRSYTIPIWEVNSELMDFTIVNSDKIYDTWDRNRDSRSDVGVPITRAMWGENTGDGHICIIDRFTNTAWEMSRFGWSSGQAPHCTTFNIWDLSGRGYADADAPGRWQLIGGRGSGFPLIAGLVRPEEVEAGVIRHALVFTFGSNRKSSGGDNMFISPPGARSDGKFIGEQYPIEGSLFQLDPSLTDRDFDAWGLSQGGRVVARALQNYGMYLCDNGGDWALQAQLLSPDSGQHRALWEERLPGFYSSIEAIPTHAFRIIDSGEVVVKP